MTNLLFIHIVFLFCYSLVDLLNIVVLLYLVLKVLASLNFLYTNLNTPIRHCLILICLILSLNFINYLLLLRIFSVMQLYNLLAPYLYCLINLLKNLIHFLHPNFLTKISHFLIIPLLLLSHFLMYLLQFFLNLHSNFLNHFLMPHRSLAVSLYSMYLIIPHLLFMFFSNFTFQVLLLISHLNYTFFLFIALFFFL